MNVPYSFGRCTTTENSPQRFKPGAPLNAECNSIPSRLWLCHVVCIASIGTPHKLSNDVSTSRLCMFKALQYQHTCREQPFQSPTGLSLTPLLPISRSQVIIAPAHLPWLLFRPSNRKRFQTPFRPRDQSKRANLALFLSNSRIADIVIRLPKRDQNASLSLALGSLGFELLTSALSHDKAVPVFVPRPRGSLGAVVALREGFAGNEAADARGDDGCISPTCQHEICFSPPNVVRRTACQAFLQSEATHS